MKLRKRKDGYLDINIMHVKKLVHVLVWEAFNGPVPDGYEINHINCVRDDNSLDNLSIMSHYDNVKWDNADEKRGKPVLQYTIEGEFVASQRVMGAIKCARIVMEHVVKRKARKELVRCLMYGIEIGRGAWLQVPYREFKFDAYAPRARAAQRGEESRIERVGYVVAFWHGFGLICYSRAKFMYTKR